MIYRFLILIFVSFGGNPNTSGLQKIQVSMLSALSTTLIGMYGRAEYELESNKLEKMRTIYYN